MSYRFCFGASGAGKSYRLHREIIERTGNSFDRPGFYIVPEQFTMQTQKDLVNADPRGGIMNVDVLSFRRLAHRIFEETGVKQGAVLDDVGKSLILRKIAGNCMKDLKVIGSQIGHLGMVSEVKSVISEFMQYGIAPDEVDHLSDYARQHGQNGLAMRLGDLKVLYTAFMDYKKDSFITGEETMDLLAEAIPNSNLIRNAVFVFDGFTGFTPVQYRVLSALMQNAKEVIFSVTIAEDGGPTAAQTAESDIPIDEQDLFYLSRKTIRDIVRTAEKAGVVKGEDIYCSDTIRFAASPALAHLEKALFRYPLQSFPGKDLPVSLVTAKTPSDEVRELCLRIRTLIADEGYSYRDIGIVCGDLASYASEIERMTAKYDIPVYIDTTKGVLHNPLTEAVRSALEMVNTGLAYEPVFRYLRSGLSDLTREETDILENYCLAHGVRSARKWSFAFDEEAEPIRQKFLEEIRPLYEIGRSADEFRQDGPGKRQGPKSAAERTAALYAFLVQIHAQEKTQKYAERFAGEGDLVRQKEYAQIYRAVIDLLDQIYTLLGNDEISADDYLELVETGFAEIRLGTLPQKVDRILVGDIERSRLTQLKALFFIGVNDGNIPKAAGKGGLISDLDREFLLGSGEEIAPSPRQQMYIQKLYLYLNMTKPSEKVILSWPSVSFDGSGLRPSYIIGVIRRLFPEITIQDAMVRPVCARLAAPRDTAGYLAGELRHYADGYYDIRRKEKETFLTVYGLCAEPSSAYMPSSEKDLFRTEELTKAAFLHYKPERLSSKAAQRLYGRVFRGSVSRLESAAGCYLYQFMKYGLRLQKRDEYRFEPVDYGNILHESISRFGMELEKRHLEWTEISREEAHSIAGEVLKNVAAEYENQLLYSTARTMKSLERMEHVLTRSIDSLIYQLKKGDFRPVAYEKEFGDNMTYALPGGGELSLYGKIDRIDTAQSGDRLYVKILDYKSSGKDIDKKLMARGLQLQLPLYMDYAERTIAGQEGRETEPAAMLYFHFDDPLTENNKAIPLLDSSSEEAIKSLTENQEKTILKEFKVKGLVRNDPDVVALLHKDLKGSSDVIPAFLKTDGQLKPAKSLFSREEYDEMIQKMHETMIRLADDVLEGDVSASPARINSQRTACTYCEFKDVCGFDRKIPGYDLREQ